MSLDINCDTITAVLLHDGWQEVARGTAYFDAFEITEGHDDRFIVQPRAESAGLAFKRHPDSAFEFCVPLDKIYAIQRRIIP